MKHEFKQITLAVAAAGPHTDLLMEKIAQAEGDLDHDMAVIAWYGDGLSPDHFNGKCDTCNRREPILGLRFGEE